MKFKFKKTTSKTMFPYDRTEVFMYLGRHRYNLGEVSFDERYFRDTSPKKHRDLALNLIMNYLIGKLVEGGRPVDNIGMVWSTGLALLRKQWPNLTKADLDGLLDLWRLM